MVFHQLLFLTRQVIDWLIEFHPKYKARWKFSQRIDNNKTNDWLINLITALFNTKFIRPVIVHI